MDTSSFLSQPNFLDDDEEADEFLFTSIQRYDTLQMFTLENIPVHVLQIDDKSLCVASRRNKKQGSEVLKLQLPKKLMLPEEEGGRSKGNDFDVLSGIYTENEVYRIDYLKGKLITSQYNVTGFNIYTFNDCSLGSKNGHQILKAPPWTQFEFAVIQGSTHAVCSKCCHDPLIVVDLSTGEVIKEIKHDFENFRNKSKDSQDKTEEGCPNKLKCLALSNDMIAVLNTYSGVVTLHDLRIAGSFIQLPEITEKISSEIWTLSGYDYKEPSPYYFGIVSNATSFCIYDKRKGSILTQNVGESDPAGDYMRLKFNRGDKFSISGINPFVELFRIGGTEFEHIFTHTGHSPGKKSLDLVTDHIWLQAGGKEYIVSICSNSTLNCWDYKA